MNHDRSVNYPIGLEFGTFPSFWRYRWLIAASTAVLGLLGLGFSLIQDTTYEAEANMFITDPRSDGVYSVGLDPVADRSRYVRNQAEFMSTRAFAARVLDVVGTELALDDQFISNFEDYVTVIPSSDIDLITVEGRWPTASGAATVANAVVGAYQDAVRDQVQTNANVVLDELIHSRGELQSRVDQIGAQLAPDSEQLQASRQRNVADNLALQAERDAVINQLVGLDTRIEQINVNLALYGSGVLFLDPATPPGGPAAPRPLLNVAAGLFIGLLAGGVVAWFLSVRRPRTERPDQPAIVLDRPLLADLSSKPPEPSVELHQFLLSSLERRFGTFDGSALVVTSAGQSRATTSLVLRLAEVGANRGYDILAVDSDTKVSELTKRTELSSEPGLTDLNNGVQVRGSTWTSPDSRVVRVMGIGTRALEPNRSLSGVVPLLRPIAALSLLDAPPVLTSVETLDLVDSSDGVVLVVEPGAFVDELVAARNRLCMSEAPLLGYVFSRSQ